MTPERASIAVAALIAAAVLWAGANYGSTSVGGSDSFGYISQAGLWQQRAPAIHQDIVLESPWPFAAATWTPLGYVPSVKERDAIVPAYAPGYPLLVAVAQIVAGYCAGFLVVPLCGALTIGATYLLARRLFAGHLIALGACVLVATSPVFLYQLMNPMSDVPVTAAWTAAVAFAVWNCPLCAGLATGAAIAIRPNLAPLAGLLCVWLAIADRRSLARAAIGIAPALIGVALVNARLYGSPLASGYGPLNELYALANLPTNLRLFAGWTLEVQTPLLLAAAIPVIAPQWTAARPVRGLSILTAGTIAVVVASYLFYLPFDAWWYLRFLLPAGPVLLVLSAAGIEAIVRRWAEPIHVVLTAGVLAGWSAYGVYAADSRSVFEFGRGERAYVEIGRYLAEHTEPEAVILSNQYSGAVRHYADRLTLRYERLPPGWLDRVIAELQARGRHPYLVLTASEEAEFRKRFAGAGGAGALDWKPVAVHAVAPVSVYDAVDRSRTQSPEIVTAVGRSRARWHCDPPAIWPPRLRMK
jgi:hypothetical protein